MSNGRHQTGDVKKDPNLSSTEEITATRSKPHDAHRHNSTPAEIKIVDDQDAHDLQLNSIADHLWSLLDENQFEQIAKQLNMLHPADASDLLERLELEHVALIVKNAHDAIDVKIWTELRDDYSDVVINNLPQSTILKTLDGANSDDAVAFASKLDKDSLAQIYEKLDDHEQIIIENLLDFDEDSVGRLMQKEFVAAPIFWTAGQVLDHMRTKSTDLPDEFFEIYVVDATFKLRGRLPLHQLVQANRELSLREIKQDIIVDVKPDTDREDAAYLFEKYGLICAPVTDEFGRLSGVVTVDDMVSVLREESDEDALALAGVDPALHAQTLFSRTRSRVPWLMMNLVTAIVASIVIGLFGATIEQMVALAILMPIVAALGGNAGIQTLTVTVRALASRDVSRSNAFRLVRLELFASFINGAILAILLGVVAFIWFQNVELGVVIGIAIWANFLCAGLSGILFPLILRKFGADPAVASSVFVTTATDLVGFFVFLGLASLFLIH